VIDLSLSQNYAAALQALKAQAELESESAKSLIYIADAQIGFYYLAFKEKRISAKQCLNKILQVAETGISRLSPDKAAALLNAYDAMPDAGDANAPSLISAALETFGELASCQWQLLMGVNTL
jgi:hypothetical protein